MNPTNFTTLEWTTFISSIASIILAILAIWLALRFFFSTNKFEKESSKLLTGIETQTALIQKVTGKMLNKYVDFSTTPQPDAMSEIVIKMLETTRTSGLVEEPNTFRQDDVLLELTNLYIAIQYHSSINNMLIQQWVTEDVNTMDDGVKTLLNQTKGDFIVSTSWVARYGTDFIDQVSTKQYYDIIESENLADEVRDPIEAVKHKSVQ